MYKNNGALPYAKILSYVPLGAAVVRGGEQYPDIEGLVRFYQTPRGVVVSAEFNGLPTWDDPCQSPIFAFHIHTGPDCTGEVDDPFAHVGSHYDPYGCPHPYHAGDMPPLFGAGGTAFSAFLTNRFTVEEILGKTVILHGSPDDFTTQPSGNAGERIACGRIDRVRRL